MTTTLRDADKSLGLMEWRLRSLESDIDEVSKRLEDVERKQWQLLEREQWRKLPPNQEAPEPGPPTDTNQRKQHGR